MDLTKLSRVVAGLVATAGMPVALAFPAFADCGDPGQPACMGPVTTVDQVVAIMAELTDPDIPASTETVTSSQRSLTAAASEARSTAAQNPLHSLIPRKDDDRKR